jgi:hypothetical protein
MEARRVALGVILGGAVGLLLLSCFILWTRATVLYFIAFSLGMVVIVPLGLSVWLGLQIGRTSTALPVWPWPVLGLVAVLLWPSVALLPFGARLLQLRLFVPRRIPHHPGAQQQAIRIRLGDEENTSDEVRVLFLAKVDTSEIVGYYRAQLHSRGWKDGPPGAIEMQLDSTPYWFEHSIPECCRTLHIKMRLLERDGLRFEVVYEPRGTFGI